MTAIAVRQTRKKAERKRREVVEEETRPEELTKQQVNRQTESTQSKRFKVLRSVIERFTPSGGINFYDLVIDRDSYGHTSAPHMLRIRPTDERSCRAPLAPAVENIFDVSFLVKDGMAGIEIDKAGEPIIKITEAPKETQRDVRKVQNILQLNKVTYEDLCTRYGAQSLLTRRKRGDADDGPSASRPPAKRASAGSGTGCPD